MLDKGRSEPHSFPPQIRPCKYPHHRRCRFAAAARPSSSLENFPTHSAPRLKPCESSSH
ncbi:unnamed protein product [Linum tenue]|uniref:Uncharacterized protein n=1 Tax=Linum tenue TaxID=586396 RepID=A0AAV0I1N3_9ROSI|nr:unnamed protein product [Linum tenue]